MAILPRVLVALVMASLPATTFAKEAATIVKEAIEYWRDVSSYSVADMIIHRPDWERTMTLRVWTRGQKESLVRVIAPPKDAGNGTLLLDDDLWSYSPKINRVIKLPSSMMGQGWMGSDFSNNDLSRADDLIDRYTHRLLGTETHEGHALHVIESVPHETAPVVWGREVIKVRDDHLVIEHAFYDQRNVLVKRLLAVELKRMGGKLVASRERMQRVDRVNEWTEIVTREAQFGIPFPPAWFSIGHLQNPRE